MNWSEKFKLTVHGRSIYPCEGSGGVAVLFEYPSCRLEGDRVRVYGRLKADVTSVASPSSLHYITESKSIHGKHSLAFDCDIFTEKFVEYCFIYVSQAITGAMGDVKISCIPTFPSQGRFKLFFFLIILTVIYTYIHTHVIELIMQFHITLHIVKLEHMTLISNIILFITMIIILHLNILM